MYELNIWLLQKINKLLRCEDNAFVGTSQPVVSPLAYPSEETRSVREGDPCLRMKSPVIIDSRRTLRFPPEAESLESRLSHPSAEAPTNG